jgi:actin related protein 2/3 complex subunit 1A/1B
MPVEHQLVHDPIAPISCHAWNGDRTMLAISPNSSKVNIYKYENDKFTLLHKLKEHTQRVTSIDWAPKTNVIVTCGEDRNAYVWNYVPREEGAQDFHWRPTLVILRINRAATCVKFSPNEDKFAVGSGARLVSVCHFEEEHDWWVSKHIKKPIRSTVLCLDWHPNNVLLAAGSSDFKTRIFCAAIKGVDKRPQPTCWGDKKKFGELLAEFRTSEAGGGWIHDVSFSADGNQLAFVAHDSSVYVADGSNDQQVTRLITRQLPFRAVQWLTAQTFVAAGHDYTPMLFSYNSGAITFVGDMDARQEKESKSKFSALDKFRNLDSRGTTESSDLKTTVMTRHQNAISEMSVFAGSAGAVSKFASVGMDGRIVIWSTEEATKRGLTIA